jgi:SsrA-binding protein
MATKTSRKSSKSKDTTVKQAGPIAVNRRATYDYEIIETVEAGLVLTGTEIKSIRNGKVDLRGAYARELKNELWLEGMHLAIYEQGNTNNHEPKRSRKLLLHRKQADNWSAQLTQKGLTVLPLRLYIKGRVAKVLLGLAKGRHRYDKKDNLIAREADRDIRRELKGGR